MDNAEEPYDLITVLSRLEGIGREIGRGHPVRNDDLGATATGRIGLFRKMLRSLAHPKTSGTIRTVVVMRRAFTNIGLTSPKKKLTAPIRA